MLIHGLDIGGSSIKHAIIRVAADSAVVVNSFPTITLPSDNFDDLRDLVLDAVGSALGSHADLCAVGISTTGSVDLFGTVVSAGHFTGYKNISWSNLLKSRFSQIESVVTVNDGRASAWAEYCANSSGVMSQIHVVVGTGVGGGIVYKGELVLGDSGQAGYIGHIKVTTDPTPECSCGAQGCVEVLASAPAIVRHFNQGRPIAETGPSALDAVVSAARSGNEAAVEAFRAAGRWLGMAVGNAMNVLNPTAVTVGGGVLLASESIRSAGDGGPFLQAVSDGVSKSAHRRVSAIADLRAARYGNDGGMIGAARLAAIHR